VGRPNARDLPTGLFLKILKDAGFTREDFYDDQVWVKRVHQFVVRYGLSGRADADAEI
jgi:hypothetical protein